MFLFEYNHYSEYNKQLRRDDTLTHYFQQCNTYNYRL